MAKGIRINIIGDTKDLERALRSADKGLDTLGGQVERLGSRMSSIGSTMTTRVTLPIVGALGAATKAAAEDAQEQAVLANTLKNTVGATNSQVAATEKWITKMQNATGFADSQLRPALGKLAISGRSVEQSQKDLAVAMDIARARGLDLDTVTTAMAKAALGNTTSLQRMGIATKDASGATLTYDQILQNASRTMGGAAAAAAETTAGRAEILRVKMADLSEQIGTFLIPLVEKMTSFIGSLAEKFQALSPEMQKTIITVAAVVAVLGPALFIIGKLVTIGGMLIPVIQGIGGALMFLAAGPVGLVIVAIAALVAGLVIAYKKSEGFRDVVNSVADALKSAWNWIKNVWEWVGKLADKFSGLKIPKWLTPGSPTPLEMGLRGIKSAMQDVVGVTPNALAIGTAGGTQSAPSGDIVLQVGQDTLGRISRAALLNLKRGGGTLGLA